MKSIHIPKKFDSTNNQGFLFMIQAMAEKLFIHANDSFKIKTLCTKTRIFELMQITDQVIDTSRTIKTITPLLHELCNSIEVDPVIERHNNKNLIKSISDQLKRIANSPKESDIKQVKIELGLLNKETSNYKSIAMTALKHFVFMYRATDNRIKVKILATIDAVFLSLNNSGYSTKYIRQKVNEKLTTLVYKVYESGLPIDTNEAIDEFYKSFDGGIKNCIVYLRARKLESTINIDITHGSEFEELSKNEDPKVKKFLEGIDSSHTILKYKISEATDPYSAKNKFESIVEVLLSIYQHINHKSYISLDGSGLVIEENEKITIIREHYHPMLYGIPIKGRAENNRQAGLILEELSEKKSDVTLRIVNALQYHKSALNCPTDESSIVNIWAALEGIMPQPSSEKARIEHYLELIIPILSLSYNEKRLRYLAKLAIDSKDLVAIVREIPYGNSDFEKFCILISCKSQNKIASKLLSALAKNPYYAHVLFEEHNRLSTTKGIISSLDAHKSRLRQHISRIYINRNSIMHSASKTVNSERILENLHSYFDAVINSLIHIMSENKNIKSIEMALSKITHHENMYCELLKINQKNEVDFENYHTLLFGDGNPIFGALHQ